MSETRGDEQAPAKDEEILARLQRTRNLPSGSRSLGYRVMGVNQAEKIVEIGFEAREDLHLNPMGQVQGGFLCAMLDEAMSVACLVASGMTHVAPTAEMKTSFYRPAKPGALRAVGRVARWGRSLAFTEGELFDRDGRLVAKATGTAVPTPLSNFR